MLIAYFDSFDICMSVFESWTGIQWTFTASRKTLKVMVLTL